MRASAMPRSCASGVRRLALSSLPWMYSSLSLRQRAPTTGFCSFDRTSILRPAARARSRPRPSERLQKTASLPSSRTSTRLSVNTPSKSNTTSSMSRARSLRRSSMSTPLKPSHPPPSWEGRETITLRLGDARVFALLARDVLGRKGDLRRQIGEQGLADEFAKAIRRHAAARRLDHHVRGGEHCAGAEVARGIQALAHLLARVDLEFLNLLLAVAERHVDAAQVAHHLVQAGGRERELVVRARPRAVQGEVLLHHRRAEHVRDRGCKNAVIMTGVADHGLGEGLAQRGDHAQIEVLVFGRIARGAMQDAHLAVVFGYGVICEANLIQGRGA